MSVDSVLAIHIGIYHQTQASAFINQPEFYYNRFVIRDANGSTVREVSMMVGCLSYVTAALFGAPLLGNHYVVEQTKTSS